MFQINFMLNKKKCNYILRIVFPGMNQFDIKCFQKAIHRQLSICKGKCIRPFDIVFGSEL